MPSALNADGGLSTPRTASIPGDIYGQRSGSRTPPPTRPSALDAGAGAYNGAYMQPAIGSAWPSSPGYNQTPTREISSGSYNQFAHGISNQMPSATGGYGSSFLPSSGVATASSTPPASATGQSDFPFGIYKVGDKVEIWSKSNSMWCRGRIDRAEGNLVSVTYKSLDGSQICKVMPNGHESIRLAASAAMPENGSSNAMQPSASHNMPPSQARSPTGVATPGPLSFAASIPSERIPASLESEVARSLQACRADQDNRECADCGAANPEWASLQEGTLVCLNCAGVHRCLGMKAKSLAKPEFWTAAEASTFCSQGGNIAANRRLAQQAGLTAPRPPPDTDRAFVERYIVKKYRGTHAVKSQMCADASRALVNELAEEVERKRRAEEEKRRAEEEARLAQERAAREAQEAAERARRQEQASQMRAGGFRDATPTRSSLSRNPPSAMTGNDAGGSGLVVADIVAVNLFNERVRDLRYMGAWFLNLTVVLSLGKITSLPTASRSGSATVRWEPAEQRELRWDCQERWLWCRVDDNLVAGSKQLAGVGVVDVRAAELEAVDNGTGVKVAEMELEILAKDPGAQDQAGRDRSAACWQVAAGQHGPPGPPGAHGHYMYEQVEDIDNISYGQTCGTVILRLTVIDPLGHSHSMPALAPATAHSNMFPQPPQTQQPQTNLKFHEVPATNLGGQNGNWGFWAGNARGS